MKFNFDINNIIVQINNIDKKWYESGIDLII